MKVSFRANESALCATYIDERLRASLSFSHLRTIHPGMESTGSPLSAFVCHLTDCLFPHY